jgi:hypothetical protein
MKLTRSVIAVVALLALGSLAAGAAGAATVEDCQARLATVRANTEAAEAAFTNESDVTRLIGKVDAATAKLAEGKNADAVQKLLDFQTMLDALATAPKPKLDPAVAQALAADAQAAIDCVNAATVV